MLTMDNQDNKSTIHHVADPTGAWRVVRKLLSKFPTVGPLFNLGDLAKDTTEANVALGRYGVARKEALRNGNISPAESEKLDVLYEKSVKEVTDLAEKIPFGVGDIIGVTRDVQKLIDWSDRQPTCVMDHKACSDAELGHIESQNIKANSALRRDKPSQITR